MAETPDGHPARGGLSRYGSSVPSLLLTQVPERCCLLSKISLARENIPQGAPGKWSPSAKACVAVGHFGHKGSQRLFALVCAIGTRGVGCSYLEAARGATSQGEGSNTAKQNGDLSASPQAYFMAVWYLSQTPVGAPCFTSAQLHVRPAQERSITPCCYVLIRKGPHDGPVITQRVTKIHLSCFKCFH